MVPALFLFASVVNDVRALVAAHDFAAADHAVRVYQARQGATPELAAALSWLARGSLDARQFDRADSYATETRGLADQLLETRKLDADSWLPTAVGASIEVHAQVLAARGERPEALEFLRLELKLFSGTSLTERIRKNVNLLSLEGKPAPPLEVADWVGARPVSLAALRGRPVLLFFWAHWCGDCKAEVAILARIRKTFEPQGLVIVAPTRYYGYAAKGADATPQVEKNYIDQVRRQYYSELADVAAPLSAANFVAYGSSTTPTLVLIDAAGIVRMYHPGALSEPGLSARIQTILKK
ncbi:MAG: TlpA disulfide reductase family protein [Bryobacteraceae bacterium]|jgi:thiol-disulfide isomerase/thioredoxin